MPVSQEILSDCKNLFFPFSSKKMYGGQIMAQSIDAASKILDHEFAIISYNTLFLAPVDCLKQVEYKATINGGGKTIKYIVSELNQDGNKAVTTCIFSKNEESLFFLKSGTEKICFNFEFISYEKHMLDYIKKFKNYENEKVAEKFQAPFDILKHFEESIDISIGDSNEYIVKLKFKEPFENKSHFACSLAYISDILMINCACEAVMFPWFDSEKTIISSLTQNVSFCELEYNEKEHFYFKGKCISFNEGKAFVKGEICDENGKMICVLEQIVVLRMKK